MSSDKYVTPPPPRKDDRLFRGDLRDWKNNACLEAGDEYAYREGYRRGAQILVKAVEESQADQDFLVYPNRFLYRHHIELVLKRVIKQGPYLIERPLTKAQRDHLQLHRLDVLWEDFKPMAAAISDAAGWNEVPPEDIQGIDDYIRQIVEVDPGSYSLRYAHSKKGDSSLPRELTHVNLRHFGELMDRLANYLYGLEAAICHLEGLKQDWEAEMRDMADDYSGDYCGEHYGDYY